VLVVDDVRRLAEDIAEGLRDQGIAADVAYDGMDAVAKLDTNAYDVVVLDRDLPRLHGDTVCRIVTEGDCPAMVLMLTAAGEPGDRVSGLSLGADDYLPKPFHFPELVLRVRSLARRKPAARPRILRAAGLTLDPLRRTVNRCGQQVDLSVKEFAVLEALLTAFPGTLSAENLLEQVWDENADPFTKTVQVTVWRLRRKLGQPPVIETIPGVGYRIPDNPVPAAPPATSPLPPSPGLTAASVRDRRTASLRLPVPQQGPLGLWGSDLRCGDGRRVWVGSPQQQLVPTPGPRYGGNVGRAPGRLEESLRQRNRATAPSPDLPHVLPPAPRIRPPGHRLPRRPNPDVVDPALLTRRRQVLRLPEYTDCMRNVRCRLLLNLW
jgi:DNA-binding response OmpR family regulator